MGDNQTTRVQYTKLPLGSRFQYTVDGDIYVKIEENVVAQFYLPTQNRVMQGIFSAEESRAKMEKLVVIVSTSKEVTL